jgi:hypothetical protein
VISGDALVFARENIALRRFVRLGLRKDGTHFLAAQALKLLGRKSGEAAIEGLRGPQMPALLGELTASPLLPPFWAAWPEGFLDISSRTGNRLI